MNRTNIEYLTHTWNPIVMRCSRVSPACDNCWHLSRADMLARNPKIPTAHRAIYAGNAPPRINPFSIDDRLRVKKPSVIGVQFMGDLFHKDVPEGFRHKVYSEIVASYRHIFLILSKRPKAMAEYLLGENPWIKSPGAWRSDIFDHVWHGLTVCNQQEADEKLPAFLKVPGKKFLSIEPMLGVINIEEYLRCPKCGYTKNDSDIHWDHRLCATGGLYPNAINAVIVGGETGAKARPMNPDWARSIRDQCIESGTPFFFKQWGEWIDEMHTEACCVKQKTDDSFVTITPDGHDYYGLYMCRVGKKKAGRLLDGREWNELPWKGPGR